MTDIRLRAMTMNRRGITLHNTYIMQHSRFFQKLHINRQFPMFPNYLQTAVSHLTRVLQQNPAELIIHRVILIYDCLIVHHFQYLKSLNSVKIAANIQNSY